MAKKKTVSKSDIITFYMDYVLEHNENPKTIFAFAKMNNFEEALFYKHYSSFEAIEKGIFEAFFENSITILDKSEDYKIFDARNKLLSFYYTFFENLTANRSYVKYVLDKYKGELKGLKILSGLKKHFTAYVHTLEIQMLDLKQEQLEKIQDNEEVAKDRLNKNNATDIYDGLKQLKGSALKVAQMLSMEKSILPQAYVEKFSLAQFSVPPLSPPLVIKTFKKYFGKHPDDIFDTFNATSVNAASIGRIIWLVSTSLNTQEKTWTKRPPIS